MMENKDLEAEIRPLKKEDRKLQGTLGTPAGKEDPLKGTPQLSHLSRCRTVVFFLSLFICLFTVFVVSFIVPCPERSASQGTWRINFSQAVTYDFLGIQDVNRDRIQDILILYKSTNSSNASSGFCLEEGFASPCTFVAALSGANGSILWERPAAQDKALVDCADPPPEPHAAAPACFLLGRSSSLMAVDSATGGTLWSHPSLPGRARNASILSALLRVPDIDADGSPDLLVLTQEGTEVKGYMYSGSTGQQIGQPGSLSVDRMSGGPLHVTRADAHYVLFPCGGSLCGSSMKALSEEVIGRESPLRRDPEWEAILNASAHSLQLRSAGAIRYLVKVPETAGQDLLLVGSEACVLLDGQKLAPRWIFHASQVLRKPVFGHYKPDAWAVVIENGTSTDRQILLLDLSSGAVLWSHLLPRSPGDLHSASLLTADHRSAFFFWGLHRPVGTNETEPVEAQHGLYMFHPMLPNVLLQLTNVSAPIIAFRAVLLEPGRHAACVVLTGPTSPEASGLVSVTKYGVRALVSASRVVRLAQGEQDSEEAIKDRFSRLRYWRES
ncbi:protein FAM234A [Sorex fumeus]|uniref:protein FAM234A n=1 Tax=Sorex fumeus TaxID=62283 RepID=UPI0024AE2BCB|nr:protein FAM234A [Sorex fumeus]